MKTSKEKQETLAYLQHESPIWLALRDRSERCANLDIELIARRDAAMDRINPLLEELFAQNIVLQLEASHELAV